MRLVGRALVLAGAVVLATGVPAWADGPAAGSFTVVPAPDSGGTISTTSALTGNGEFHLNSGVITSITVSAKPTGNANKSASPASADACPSGSGSTTTTPGQQQPTVCNRSSVPFSVLLPALAWNGPYEVDAVAHGHTTGATPILNGPDQTGSATPIHVVLHVPPAAPTGVHTALTSNGTQVAISWAPNPEPDMEYYLVQRRNPDGTYSYPAKVNATAGSTTRLFTTDTKVPATGGDFHYSVFAVRSPGDSTDPIASSGSQDSLVHVAGTVVPTPAGGGGGPGGAPSGGGAAVGPVTPAPPGSANFGSLPSPIISHSGPLDLSKVGNTLNPEGLSVDQGAFSQDLPYGPGSPATTDAGSSGTKSALPLTTSSKGSGAKALLVPLSAGVALCVIAFQLRWLNARVSRPLDLA